MLMPVPDTLAHSHKQQRAAEMIPTGRRSRKCLPPADLLLPTADACPAGLCIPPIILFL